jgi:ribosomal protein L19
MVLNFSFYNFLIPNSINFERIDFRILPSPGDLVSIRYFERIPGRISIFRLNSCYGLCIGQKSSGLSSNFLIRNSFKRNSIEIKFLIYSPLLARIVSYDAKRQRYKKAKLYYLRLKKIAKSRFRFDSFKN